MRVDVKKFLFLGLNEEKDHFFSEAQKLGIIHFIDTSAQQGKKSTNGAQLFVQAIKVLLRQPPVEQEEMDSFAHARPIAEEIVKLDHELEHTEEEIRVIQLDISRVQVFGDFSLDDINFIKNHAHRILQFFCAKKGFREKAEELPDVIYIDSDSSLDYFVSITREPMRYEGMIEMKIDCPLGELKNKLHAANQKRHAIEAKLRTYSRYNHYMHQAMIAELNIENLRKAEEGTTYVLDRNLFAALGWIPKTKIDQLYKLASDLSVHVEEVAIEDKDAIPTYLENENVGRIGEDLIGIYDTPSITDKDPSLWVLFCFAFFFAMIVGDAGYGSIMLGLALYLKYKFPNLKGAKKRMLNLFMLLCASCIIWGVATTAYFGFNIGPDNPLRKYSLIGYLVEKKAEYHLEHRDEVYQSWVKQFPEIAAAKTAPELLSAAKIEKGGHPVYELMKTLSDQSMLEIALVVGVTHIFFGMLRYVRKNPQNIGWMIFLIGAFLYFPTFLGTVTFVNYLLGADYQASGQAGLHLIMIGIPTAVVLSIYQHGLLGVEEIMRVVQVFADVLSYLRLYALGLSGAILGETINDLAGMLPFVLAVVLIIIGHIVNMVLTIGSGIIHGLRLNFLEWYHYSFEGGGRKFKPLELKEMK